jgi:hypothetical protein
MTEGKTFETCSVSFHSKFYKLIHLVGFAIEMLQACFATTNETLRGNNKKNYHNEFILQQI